DLAVATRSDEFSISARVKDLLEQGLIELSQPPADRLDTMAFPDEGVFGGQTASPVDGPFPAEGAWTHDAAVPVDDVSSSHDAAGAHLETPIDQVVDTVDAVATWQYDPLSGDTRPAESDVPSRSEVPLTSAFLTGPELMPPPADIDASGHVGHTLAAAPSVEFDQAYRDEANRDQQHRDEEDDVAGRYCDPTPSGQHGAGEFGVVIPGYSTLSKPIVEEYVEPEIDDHDGPVELGNLTPAAARAIAAAAQATNEAEREAAIDRAIALNDEPLDRRTLIRFLTSVRS
ncbi:MAG: hypothetical protein AB7Q27_16280, partial [Acidimicrobiia bacterium]